MVSRYSPPVLYLSDDTDDEDNNINNTTDQNIRYNSLLTRINNDNLPRKKRKLTDTNVRINPSVVNWSKRQRNDLDYQHHSIHHEPESFSINPNEYNLHNQQSHSFQAFDWSTESRGDPRTYSNPMQTSSSSRLSTIPPSNVMNVVKQHLDQSDTISLSHQYDRYIQQSQRKSIHIPVSATVPPPPQPPPLSLPLPTPTSSFIRPLAQRVQSGKNNRIAYSHSVPSPPPPPPLIPVHRPIKQVIVTPTHRPPSPASMPVPISTPEIRRQPLNGTGILSAFYDSKCYRCNICKYKSVTSASLLQHLFTHIFFCHQCPFYSHSHHTLYQHIFEKHNMKLGKDTTDPKNLDLLYLTRCTDGTFALCMDSSPPTPPTPTPVKPVEKPVVPPPPPPAQPVTNNKPKIPKRKAPPKPKKEIKNVPVVIPEKTDTTPKSPLIAIPKRPIVKENKLNTFVLMKHRRCFTYCSPPCLHSLTLEYNICRTHTIQHMCHKQGVLKQYKIKAKINKFIFDDEVGKCLKTVVNQVIEVEEDRELLSAPLCALSNDILNLIFTDDDLNILKNHFKLNNKYEKYIEQKIQNQSEHIVRANNQAVFLLSASSVNKNEQSVLPTLPTTVTNDDSTFTQTKLNILPISHDNTHRFLKGNLNTPIQPKKHNTILRSISSTSTESTASNIAKPRRSVATQSTTILDKNNNSVTSSSPAVIVID